nr:protein stabilized1 [Tanacetum cinerariifolium]
MLSLGDENYDSITLYLPPTFVKSLRGGQVTSKLKLISVKTASNIKKARELIKKGFEECPMYEDVCIEACRLENPDEAKAMIAKGVEVIPKSVKLWMQAAKLEHDDAIKSMVLRKALENIPD